MRFGRRPLVAAGAALLVAGLLSGCGPGGSATPAALGAGGRIVMDASTVRTVGGVVRGVVRADYRRFEGIPYATAPVGRLRWRPPRPAAPWPGVRDAGRAGPWCVQEMSSPAAMAEWTSEDCLTLNVWTPTGVAQERRPVLVWIHGGGFVKGSGDIYDARRLTSRGDVIVVTINYRLGALGFLADPALGEAGNFGLADQQAALRWVRDNIAGFGGDPARVTIAGESAGAMSVCDHLVAPDSAGLFRAAIIQSGPCQAQVDVVTAQRLSRDYTTAMGCTDRAAAAACLRALPADRLAKPLWYDRFGTDRLSGPVTGTPTLPSDPVQAMTSGTALRVPVMIGTNRDEFTLFVALQYLREGREIAASAYPRVLADTFAGADPAALLAHYPPAHYGGSASSALAAAGTDGVFACPAHRMTAGLARHAPAVYAYEFNDRQAPAPEIFQQAPFPIGASHALELRYLFDVGGAPALDAAQRRLSEQMIDYWSQFVVTGAPGAAGQPDWPSIAANPSEQRWLSLRPDGSRMIADYAADHQCRFWARFTR